MGVRGLGVALGLALLPGLAAAEAGKRFIDVAGVKTVSVRVRAAAPAAAYPAPPAVVIGAPLPAEYMMLFNPEALGLPRPRDGWVYFEAGSEIYRVDLSSREVLERVTDQVVRKGG